MERPRQAALARIIWGDGEASQGGVALAPSLTNPKSLEPPGNLGHGVGAGLCCMWRMWMCSAEALALSLLMFARCRIWLLCDPDGAVAAAALAAGAV